MAGSSFGDIFRITTWGESHGTGIGVVVDGCPAGLPVNDLDIQAFMDRRKPGSSKIQTKRSEGDRIRIMSGVFEGRTTGTPISLMIDNNAQRSADYEANAMFYRPGHADYTYDMKYGFRDYRGGGRSSGRETAGRVAGGAIAEIMLRELGISVFAYTRSIGDIIIDYSKSSFDNIDKNDVHMPDMDAAKAAEDYILALRDRGESVGGVIECVISGVPAGIGDPVFDKLDARLSEAIMSIGAVKGVEIGDGFGSAFSVGSQNNDSFVMGAEGRVFKKTNHAGGILGGISDGSQIILRAAVKPTPSIYQPQQTVNRNFENCEINIAGRHDPVIVPRAVVVVETMAATVVADLMLKNMSARMDNVKLFYSDCK